MRNELNSIMLIYEPFICKIIESKYRTKIIGIQKQILLPFLKIANVQSFKF